MEDTARVVPSGKAAAVSIGLACGVCVGWTFAVAVDLVRPAASREAPAFEPARPSSALDVDGY
jgi:hypothetical protein